VKVGVVGVEGMMTLPNIGALVPVRLKERIACIALPVPPDSSLKVLPLSTARCGTFYSFDGGSFIPRTPLTSQFQVWSGGTN